MKVAVIGYGNVGMAVFNSLLHMPEINDLVLVGRNQNKIKGEIEDYLDAMILNPDLKSRIDGGGYEKLESADIIVYTVSAPIDPRGINDRNALLKKNIEVAKEVSDNINKYNKDAIIVVVSNPVDVLVSVLKEFTNRPAEKIVGTGTLLDSMRLCRQLAEALDVGVGDVIGYVFGEHGEASLIVWSWMSVFGRSFDEYCAITNKTELTREEMLKRNRYSGFEIVKQKGNTCYGVAVAAMRIVSSIIHDVEEVLPVSTELAGEYGISDVALSVPCIIGRNGAVPVGYMQLDEEEMKKLKAAAEKIKAIKDEAMKKEH